MCKVLFGLAATSHALQHRIETPLLEYELRKDSDMEFGM